MPSYKIPDPNTFYSRYDHKNTHLIVLQNSAGMQVALTDYGARIVSIIVPNKHGDPTDVVLGFDSIAAYFDAKEKYHGATIGRYANRIANGQFTLDGQVYDLEQNNGTNNLHGGSRGFHDRVWDRQLSFHRKVDFYYVAKDGEEGFPGNLKVHVSYELTNENELKIKYRANTDKKTVINLTNHAYFNLNGEGNGDILNHVVEIPADTYLPVDERQIPLNKGVSVEGTVFDLRTSAKVADKLDQKSEDLSLTKGFDHSYVNEQPFSNPAATAYSEISGIRLEVYTTEPSVHFYTGNSLNTEDVGKNAHRYLPYAGFCFETQHYPDSPNRPDFPSVVLEKGKEFKSETTYKFLVNK